MTACDGHEAGGSANRTHRREYRVGRFDDIHPCAPERARDQGLLAVGRESRGGDRGDLERVPGFLRVADQMNAVEQQTRASRVGALGERAETRDDGVLPTRDGAHA